VVLPEFLGNGWHNILIYGQGLPGVSGFPVSISEARVNLKKSKKLHSSVIQSQSLKISIKSVFNIDGQIKIIECQPLEERLQ